MPKWHNTNQMNQNKQINWNITNQNATLILKSFFNSGLSGVGSILINNPVYHISYTTGSSQSKTMLANSVCTMTITLSYYIGSSTMKIHDPAKGNIQVVNLIHTLTQMYESILGYPIHVELEIVRQYQPYMDATILAQYVAINANKYGFNRMISMLLKNVPFINPNLSFSIKPLQDHLNDISYSEYKESNNANTYITGLKIQLSGLLTSQRNRSRKSVYTASAGTFSSVDSFVNDMHTQKINNQSINNTQPNSKNTIDYGTYTSKSQLGAFTVKVWLASIIQK